MGAKVSRTQPQPPPYQCQENDDYEYEEDQSVIEELQNYFKTKVLASLCYRVIEKEIYKITMLANMYGINLPVSLRTPEEFEILSDQEKETYNRINMGLISDFLGRKWIDT